MEGNDFSGRINKFGYDPYDTELELDQKEYKKLPTSQLPIYSQKKEGDFFIKFLFTLIVLALIVLSIFITYYVAEGKFQNSLNVDQPININPNFNHTTENTYEQSNTNNFNHTFILNLDKDFLNKICNQSG